MFTRVFIFFSFICIFSTIYPKANGQSTSTEKINSLVAKYPMLSAHQQLYNNSCIASGVEMLLKVNKKVRADFYKLQHIWQNKIDGTFANFDGMAIEGMRFHIKYSLPRNDLFPFDRLFKTIDEELSAGRKLLISFTSGTGWHIWIITDKLPGGDYLAISKNGKQTLVETNVRRIVRNMKGTDILTYTTPGD